MHIPPSDLYHTGGELVSRKRSNVLALLISHINREKNLSFCTHNIYGVPTEMSEGIP
jgi:hypothetical protein